MKVLFFSLILFNGNSFPPLASSQRNPLSSSRLLDKPNAASSEIYFLLFFLPLVLHFSLEIKVLYRFFFFRPSVSLHGTKLLFSCASFFRNFPPGINYLLSLETSQREIKFET